MKSVHELLHELARPEVAEFAVASDRLPCVKIGDRYDPIDEVGRSTEAILEMLVAVGGSRHVEDLAARPVQWTTRVEAVGVVAVHAVMRSGRVQARFSLVKRDAGPPPLAGRPPTRPTPRSSIGGGAPHDDLLDPTLPLEEGIQTSVPVRLDDLLAAARAARASDVHVIAGRPLLLRLGGELVPQGAALDAEAVEQMVLGVVPERLRPSLDENGSADFALDRSPHGRFRVNVSRQRTGYKGSFRCIPSDVPTLAGLGLPIEIERATHHHQGLVLVTGPTGHGKTSTLAAIVDIINRDTTHHIITVEDPIEYLHVRKKAVISQREVGTHTRTFAAALKASLREDPDVIVVGELRDTETVQMALAASETGHLVLGTMNTPSVAKTIDRIVDLFPPGDQAQVRMTLAGGLHMVVGQRLLPSADGKGMVAATELLPGSIALWNLIRDGKTYQIPSLQQRGKGIGILRLDESLADRVRDGSVTREAALGFAENPDDLDAALGAKRSPPAQVETPKKPEGPGLLGKAGNLFGKRGP